MASIGPELPPGFKTHQDSGSDDEATAAATTTSIGPALPPGFKVPAAASSSNSSDSDSDSEPGTRKRRRGVQMTSEATAKRVKTQEGESDDEQEDSYVIGPMPPSADQTCSSAADEFERRAKRMKDKLLNQDVPVPKERDTWMTELPALMAKSFPLENRTFSRKGISTEQDSSWTDAPNAKRKKQKSEQQELVVVSKRDQEMAEQVDQHNKTKRDLSLLELHQKKHSKKSKKEKTEKKEKKHKKEKKEKKDKKEKKKDKADKKERRPFDRDEDLKVNQFDDAMRKNLIKKSSVLNTRFGHGEKQFI